MTKMLDFIKSLLLLQKQELQLLIGKTDSGTHLYDCLAKAIQQMHDATSTLDAALRQLRKEKKKAAASLPRQINPQIPNTGKEDET